MIFVKQLVRTKQNTTQKKKSQFFFKKQNRMKNAQMGDAILVYHWECIRVDNAVTIIIIKCGIIRKYSSHRHLMTANFIYLIVQVNNKESLGEEN